MDKEHTLKGRQLRTLGYIKFRDHWFLPCMQTHEMIEVIKEHGENDFYDHCRPLLQYYLRRQGFKKKRVRDKDGDYIGYFYRPTRLTYSMNMWRTWRLKQ